MTSTNRMRTVFIENGLPIIEDHSDVTFLEWMNVEVREESHLSDLQLIDAIIDLIQAGETTVTMTPKQWLHQGIVSFPLLQINENRKTQILVTSNLAMTYREDIMYGRVSFDRGFLFNGVRPY
jgi:hypothetical protein